MSWREWIRSEFSRNVRTAGSYHLGLAIQTLRTMVSRLSKDRYRNSIINSLQLMIHWWIFKKTDSKVLWSWDSQETLVFLNNSNYVFFIFDYIHDNIHEFKCSKSQSFIRNIRTVRKNRSIRKFVWSEWYKRIVDGRIKWLRNYGLPKLSTQLKTLSQ